MCDSMQPGRSPGDAQPAAAAPSGSFLPLNRADHHLHHPGPPLHTSPSTSPTSPPPLTPPVPKELNMALCWVAATLLLAAGLLVAAQATAGPPVRNILYVVVDDLRPELPMYGQTHMQTPHLSSLAARGLTFNRAYAQQ